ncbi:MAG: ATP-dependent sacrificial sulfur transferase LarE [Nitrososphaerales archaeon]
MSDMMIKNLPDRSTVKAHLDESAFLRYCRLIDWFKDEERSVIALSGGVDSSVVAAAALISQGASALAVTSNSSTFTALDLADAENLAKSIGIRHLVVNVDDPNNSGFINNSPERCFYCREELVKVLAKVAAKESSGSIVDGMNTDDLVGHRPGIMALRNGGVRSPLIECGIGKAEVRNIARALGLPSADKPSNACLASRFPYGETISKDKMDKVAQAEELVKVITGAKQVRVRHHGDIARIEVGKDERNSFFNESLMDSVHTRLKEIGYNYVSLDLAGYRNGSMDETLELTAIPSKSG